MFFLPRFLPFQCHPLDLFCSHYYRTLLLSVAGSQRLQLLAPATATVGVRLLLPSQLVLGEKALMELNVVHEIEVNYHVSLLLSFKLGSNAYFVLNGLLVIFSVQSVTASEACAAMRML